MKHEGLMYLPENQLQKYNKTRQQGSEEVEEVA